MCAGGEEIEENIQKIIASPQASSNPYDYLQQHEQEYKNIVGYGEAALTYLRGEFEKGNNDDLRGYMMMLLMQDILSKRDTVEETGLSPRQWYQALNLQDEIILPDYMPEDGDGLNRAVYEAVQGQNTDADKVFWYPLSAFTDTTRSKKAVKCLFIL